MRLLLAALAAIALGAPQLAAAQSFRRVEPIASPVQLPDGAQRVAELRPVDPALVERAVHAVAAAWNTGALDPLLAPEFFNRSRLLDTLIEVAPRDATLRVLSIESIITLDQFIAPAEEGARRVSTVSVVVRTQAEWSDAGTGYQRLEGTNEFVFRVEEPSLR